MLTVLASSKIAFVLWVCLWPLAAEATAYLSEKRVVLAGEKPHSKQTKAFIAACNFIVWCIVAYILYT